MPQQSEKTMDIVAQAKELAYRAHAGQVDKAGRPYIEHVARVAARVADDPEAEAVAWLHDVLEDCPRHSGEVLPMFGYQVWRQVELLTRRDICDGIYYDCIAANPIALRVKLADIADNADESRLALLDETTAARLRKKYAKALAALGHNA
jgi:(p)ppGpp synthase/HD superfamily hydrolase